MSIICNDTQLVLLSAASQRDDHCLVPPPGPKRAQAQRAVAKLVEAGLVKEIRAKAGGPIWRRDGETGQAYALKADRRGCEGDRGGRDWVLRRRGGTTPGPSDHLRRSEGQTRFRPSSSHRQAR